MDTTITLRYDDRVVRAGLRGYVNRFLGWKFRALVAVMAVAFGVLAVQDTWRWYTLALGAIVALCLVASLLIYTVMLPALTRRFRTLYGDRAEFHIGDAELTVTTPHHTGHTPWPRFKRLWRFPEVWLLFTGTDSFTLLPTADLPEAAGEFIVAKVRNNGGEVS